MRMPTFKGKKKPCSSCGGWGRPRVPCRKAGKNNSFCKKCRGYRVPSGFSRCNENGLLISFCSRCAGTGFVKMKEDKRPIWRRKR